MAQEDSMKVISELSSVIGLLEHKWKRPQSEIEVAIIQTLLDVRERIRRAYEVTPDMIGTERR